MLTIVGQDLLKFSIIDNFLDFRPFLYEHVNTMKTQKSQKISISISLPQDLRDLGRQAAFDDNRPLSSLIAVLLEEHLLREGYIDHALSSRYRKPAKTARHACQL